MNKGGKGLILLFVVAFVLWRLAFLAWSQYIYDEEEAKTGSISVIVMKGPMLPLLEHQPGDYEGGTLLFGLLAIPFMMLFGKPYLGLKMMALSTSLIMALVSVVWIRKLAGGAAAVFAGVLWLFAVPYLLQVGMIPWGNYAETAMLTVVTFYLLHTILFEGKNGWWRFALLGFFFGLGTWMHYGYIVTVLVCLVFMYLSRARLFLSSRFAVTILSAVIGFMPWVIYNVTHHFWGMARFADGVRPEIPTWKIIRVVKRAMSLFVDDLPCSLHLVVGGITTTKILSYIFYLVVVGLMVYYIAGNRKNIFFAVKSLWPAWQNQARGEALAVLVPFGYFLAYAFVYSYSEYGLFSSDWAGRDPESHAHIYVMLPPMIWISAIAAGRIYEKSKAAAIVPVVLLSLLGFVGQVQMLEDRKSVV